jgi:membrane associated rhomboid family serine protease
MLCIYSVAVLSGGILITWWKSVHPTLSVSLGASDGIFGLLSGSLVLLYRPAAAGFGQRSRIRGFLWLVLAAGIAISFLPGVSLVGHLGGLVFGAILGLAVPILTAKKIGNPDDPSKPANLTNTHAEAPTHSSEVK